MSTRVRRLREAVLRSITARGPPRLASLVRKVLHRPLSQRELHAYWRKPWDGHNLPEQYLSHAARSLFLVNLLRRYADVTAKVLEIGCNVGRNLDFLFQEGHTHLAGVEISAAPLRLFRAAYPETFRHVTIHHAPIESIVERFRDREFDVVFTMAVMEHIHIDSEWIFPEIARIAGSLLITIEDERGISERTFPRNYRKVFEPLGMRHLTVTRCGQDEGFKPGIIARVFQPEAPPIAPRPEIGGRNKLEITLTSANSEDS